MGRHVRVAALSSVLIFSGCDTWITSSTPPDETLGVLLDRRDRDIVQPLSVPGPIAPSGVDVAFGRDQILVRLDRTIDATTFCVDVVGELCRPTLRNPTPNDIEVVNLTRGEERVPLARAQLVSPVPALLAEDTQEPSVEIDPDLPGGSQPLASSIWLAIDPSYMFAPGDVVRITILGGVLEAAEPRDTMPPAVLVFSVAAEDGVAPRVVSDSFTAIERLPPHAVLGLGFSEPIARLSVNVEPPLYGAAPGDAALLARDPITGGELVAGRARSVTFLPPATDSVLGIDQLYWFQVVSEDCVVDGLGACLLVPTQDESGSELAGGLSDTPVSWIRSFRTAPLAITVPTGWPRLAEHQELQNPAAFETLGRQFTIAGRYVPNPNRGPIPIHDPITEIEVFLLGPSEEFRLGSAELNAGAFSLAVDLTAPIFGGGLNPTVPDWFATSNGGTVVVEARARTGSAGPIGLDQITVGLDLAPPRPPEITSEPSRSFRPDLGDDFCDGISVEGIADLETAVVELRRTNAPLLGTVLLATVPVANGRFEGALRVPQLSSFNVFARARDAAGNPSQDSNSVGVHCKSIVAGDVPSPALELPADGFVTSDRHIRVKGTVASSVARVIVSSAGVESVVPVSSQAFDGTFLAPATGDIVISVLAEDAAGDRSSPVFRSGRVTPDVFLSTAAVSGDAQVAVAGALIAPFVVEARDSAGAPLAGVAIVFSLVAQPPAGGGLLNATPGAITVMTDSAGRGQARLTLSSDPGTSVVEASASRAATAPVVFHAVGLLASSFTGPAGPPARIIPLGGDIQRGAAGTALGEPFSVLLLDAFDRVVPDTDVFFRLVTPLSPSGGWQSPSPCPGTGAALACAKSDSNGVAKVDPGNPFELGQTIPAATATAVLAKEGDAAATLAQIVQVDACVDAGCSAAPTTSLFAVSLPGPPATLSDCPGDTFLGPCQPIFATGAVNTPSPQAPRVLVMDAFQNRIANQGVSFFGATDGATLFDAANCRFAIPIRRATGPECGADVVSLPTNTFGFARADLILGNQDAFTYGWRATAAGISATFQRISEPFDETQLFTTLITSTSPRNEGGAAMNRQEDPWAVTVVLATPSGAAEDNPWATTRKSEPLELTATNDASWDPSAATSNPSGDFFSRLSLGPAPSQVATIRASNVGLQHSFGVFRAPVIAELKREEFSLKHVELSHPTSDTFAEVWRLRATIRFSQNATPLLRGRQVTTFNGLLKVVEIPGFGDQQNYNGAPKFESDFREGSDDPMIAIPSPPLQGGLAKFEAVSLSQRACKTDPCGDETQETTFDNPPATFVFARVFVQAPSGLQEVTDPLLDLGPSPDFPKVSMSQWVDQVNLRGERIQDGITDWLGESVRHILSTAAPGRDHEILGLVSPVGIHAPGATVAFAQVKAKTYSGQYLFDSGVLNLDILEIPFRLNSQASVGVTGGIVSDSHTMSHALRGTLRHEARHVWQDFVRKKTCSSCEEDGAPGSGRNNSDGDLFPEKAFKLIGKPSDDGVATYADSERPALGWLNDVAADTGERTDDDSGLPFPPGIAGPADGLSAIDQLEINAFLFWACLEEPKYASCP